MVKMVFLIIYSCLKIDKPKFIEIGVGDYYESNTRFILKEHHVKVLIIDIIEDFKIKLKKTLSLER